MSTLTVSYVIESFRDIPVPARQRAAIFVAKELASLSGMPFTSESAWTRLLTLGARLSVHEVTGENTEQVARWTDEMTGLMHIVETLNL